MFELFLVVGVLLGVSLLGVLTVAITPRIMVELGLWGTGGGPVRRNPNRIVVPRCTQQSVGWTHETPSTVVANSGGRASASYITRIQTCTTLVCGGRCRVFSLLSGGSGCDCRIVPLEALSVMAGQKR